jgi:PBP1b-binding outer membrane lipoprotein LpoB
MKKLISVGGLALFLSACAVTAVFAEEAPNDTFTTASCTSSTGEALAANNGRTAALFINTGTSTIYLKMGEAAVDVEGIMLSASGGNYFMSAENGNLRRQVVNCITSSATVVLSVVEWAVQ